MRWSQKQGTLALITVIVIANLFLFARILYNRSGNPTASLLLSERELELSSYHYWRKSEDSGKTIDLDINKKQWLKTMRSPEALRKLGFCKEDRKTIREKNTITDLLNLYILPWRWAAASFLQHRNELVDDFSRELCW